MALHLTFSAPHPTSNLITVHETLHHGPQRLAMSERFLIGATFNAGVMQATNTHPPTAWTSVNQAPTTSRFFGRPVSASTRLHPGNISRPLRQSLSAIAANRCRQDGILQRRGVEHTAHMPRAGAVGTHWPIQIYLTAFGTRRYIAEAINGIIFPDPAAMNTLTIIEKEDVVAIGYTCLENMIT
ncbi:hypothetical protein B0H13DRAFT_1932195 [Mycena leptocephala]|nr:hypothetical protein B0H13DRAFT_1932195 [Mycena leptocephala]